MQHPHRPGAAAQLGTKNVIETSALGRRRGARAFPGRWTRTQHRRPGLLNLGEPGALDITPWAARVKRIDARYAGAWELPVLGARRLAWARKFASH